MDQTIMTENIAVRVWQRALELYATHKAEATPDELTYKSVVECCRKAGRLQEAAPALEDMVAAGVGMGRSKRSGAVYGRTVAYTMLMTVRLRDGDWEAAVAAFDAMRAADVPPNLYTYNVLIAAYQAGRQWPQVERVVDEMVMAGLAPNAMTYTILITGCASTGRVDKAMELLSSMRAVGVPPNAYAYTAAITACTKAGDWEQALHVFELAQAAQEAAQETGEPETARLMLNTVTFNAVLAACEMGKQWERALELYDTMCTAAAADAAAPRPDAMTYRTLLATCVAAGRLVQAAPMLAAALKEDVALRTGMSDAHAYTATMTACVNVSLCTGWERERELGGCALCDYRTPVVGHWSVAILAQVAESTHVFGVARLAAAQCIPLAGCLLGQRGSTGYTGRRVASSAANVRRHGGR
jgi:pentatricopeptide repeat domain-containing protein 1